MLEVVQQAVDAARRAGADYADARFVSEESESLSVKNQTLARCSRSSDCRCGQQLDMCTRAHCPRCGRSIRLG